MHSEQNILHTVFDIAAISVVPLAKRPQIGRDLGEKPTIGIAIACLRSRHELGPRPVLRADEVFSLGVRYLCDRH
jgi:hypothetical protein